MATNNYGICIMIIIFIILIFALVMISWRTPPVERYFKHWHDANTKILKYKSEPENFIKEYTKETKKSNKAMHKMMKYLRKFVVFHLKQNKDIAGKPLIKNPVELNEAIERVLATTIQESDDNSTYTINKRDVYLCDPDFINVDKNTVVHVLLHELAHSANNTIGHDESWQKIFQDILDNAEKKGIIDQSKPPKLYGYCKGNYAN